MQEQPTAGAKSMPSATLPLGRRNAPRLTDKQKELILKHVEEGMEPKDIKKALGLPQTVNTIARFLSENGWSQAQRRFIRRQRGSFQQSPQFPPSPMIEEQLDSDISEGAIYSCIGAIQEQARVVARIAQSMHRPMDASERHKLLRKAYRATKACHRHIESCHAALSWNEDVEIPLEGGMLSVAFGRKHDCGTSPPSTDGDDA